MAFPWGEIPDFAVSPFEFVSENKQFGVPAFDLQRGIFSEDLGIVIMVIVGGTASKLMLHVLTGSAAGEGTEKCSEVPCQMCCSCEEFRRI